MKIVLENKPNHHDENKNSQLAKFLLFPLTDWNMRRKEKRTLGHSEKKTDSILVQCICVFFIEPEYMEIDLYVVWNWSRVPPSIQCCQTWLQGLHLVVVDTSSHGYKWPRFLVFHIKIKWSTVIWIQINQTVFNCCRAAHTKRSKRIVLFTLCVLEYVLVVYDTGAKKTDLVAQMLGRR